MDLDIKMIVLVLMAIISRIRANCLAPLECLPVNECLENEHLKSDFIFNCNDQGGKFHQCCLPKNEQTILTLPQSGQQRERARNILPEQCGDIFRTKIVQTDNVLIGDYPWNVLLAYVRKTQRFTQFRCGGTLISRRYVLTAAQCLTDPNYTLQFVRLGELNLKTNPDCDTNCETREVSCSDTPQDIAVKKIIPYHEYQIGSLENDIGLILLTENVTFTEFIHPICLPVGLTFPEHLNKKTVIIASGWGKDNIDGDSGNPKLSFSRLMEINTTACNELIAADSQPVTKNQMCAQSKNHQTVCNADIGGPLYYGSKTAYDNIAAIQLGVVSYASRSCNDSKYPIISTRVEHYIDWILDVISNDSFN